MIRPRLKIFLFFVVSLFANEAVFCQTNYSSEDDLKREANNFFEGENFEESLPLFSQLLSIYPKDPVYNYKLGVCMLMAGENKEQALNYLQYASQKPGVDKEATFYLGKAYHINYRFDDAIREYNNYKSSATKAKLEKFQVDRQIEMCNNGKKLLSNLNDLYILDKKELTKSEYFRSYDLTDIGGKLLVKLEEFQSDIDKKKKDNSIMYLAPQNNQIVFSSYGPDGKNGRDIFIVRKQPNGEWSQPINIGPTINTKFDEDYPFLHPNGKVLYFCSKGHNSMGGYDVFKSTYNQGTNTWDAPINVDFPINTPDDDILYVTDAEEKTAYFSSARSSANGKIAVYKIGLEQKPIDIAIINGTIKTNDKPINSGKVTVKNVENGDVVGIYTVAPDGSYTLQVPNGGKMLITVDLGDGKTYSEVFVAPSVKEFKPLQQEITFDASVDKMLVQNKFDQAASESNYLLALNFIKDKARMEVNTTDLAYGAIQATETKTVEPVAEQKIDSSAITKQEPKTDISNRDIVKIAFEDAKEAEEEANTLKADYDQATALAAQKNELVALKTKELDKAKTDLSTADESQKPALQQNVSQLQSQVDALNKEAIAANNAVKKSRTIYENKKAEADLSLEYAKELENSAKNGGVSKETTAKLEQQKQKIDALAQQQETEPESGASSIQRDADNKQKEVDVSIKKSETLKNELVQLDKDIENLKADAKNTKDDQLKQAITDQITDLEIDKDQKKQEIKDNEVATKKLQDEALALKKEAEVAKSAATTNTQPNTSAINTSTTVSAENQTTETATTVNNNTTSEQTNTNPTTTNSATSASIDTTKNSTPKTTPENSVTAVINPAIETTSTSATETNTNSSSPDNTVSTSTVNSGISTEPIKTETTTLSATIDTASKAITGTEHKNSEETTNASTVDTKTTGSGTSATTLTASAPTDTQNGSSSKSEIAIPNNTITVTAQSTTVPENTNSTVANNTSQTQVNTTPVDTINKIVQNNSATPTSTVTASTQLISDTIKSESQSATVVPNSTTSTEATTNNNTTEQTKTASTETSNSTTTTSTSSNANKGSATTPVVITRNDAQVESKKYKQEAAQLQQQANATRMKANAETNPQRRDSLFNAAQAIEKQAKKKQDESAKGLAHVNKTEYDKSKIYLDQYSQLAANNSGTDATMAGMLIDEAMIYFSEAETNRKQANLSTNYSTRNDALQKAEENERIALEKQNKALELYKKNYPDYVPSETPVQVAAAKAPETTVATNSQANNVATNEVKTQNNTTSENNLSSVQTKTIATTEPVLTETNTATSAAKTETPVNTSTQQPKETNTVVAATNSSGAESTSSSNTNIPSTTTIVSSGTTETNPNTQSQPITTNTLSNTIASITPTTTSSSEIQKTTNTSPSANATTNANSATASAQLSESELSKLPNLNPAQVTEVKNSREFKNFVILSNESEIAFREAFSENAMSEDLQKMADKQLNLYYGYKAEAVGASTSEERKIAEAKRDTADKLFKKYQAESDSVYKLAKNSEAAANSKKFETELFLQSIGAGKQGEVLAAANKSGVNVKPYIAKLQTPPVGTSTITSEPIAANAQTQPVATTNTNENNQPISNTNTTTQPETTIITQQPNTTITNTQPEVKQSATTAVENTNTYKQTTEPIKTNNIVTTTVKEVFVQKATPAYSKNKPIPINEKLPDGLIFKVQIGAFKNPIPQNLFKGMSPITGETTPQGYIRYTAGIFTSVESAVKAKNTIKSYGYNDAFVVAFLNGQRIPINQAIAMAGGLTATSIADNTGSTPPTNITTNATTQQTTPATASQTEATNVKDIKGLMYTIQVGVYSKPVELDKLFNLKPIYTENMSNGFYRYTSGSYNRLNLANSAKNKIVNMGIKDAFVVAFLNSKRISIPEAQKLEQTEGDKIFANTPGMNQLPPDNVTTPSASNNTSSTVNTTPANTKDDVTNPGDKVYSVQIGAFKNEVPIDIANSFIKLASKKGSIKNFSDENGMTVYTLGNFSSYEKAAKLKQEILAEGITDAFVIATQDGKKVPVK